jgi:hypothetical protein
MAFQETDQSIDQGGLTQKYFAIQLKWSWDSPTATKGTGARPVPLPHPLE